MEVVKLFLENSKVGNSLWLPLPCIDGNNYNRFWSKSNLLTGYHDI